MQVCHVVPQFSRPEIPQRMAFDGLKEIRTPMRSIPMRWLVAWSLGIGAIFLSGCGPIDNSIHPVTITADPSTIYRGDSTRLTWSAPGGMQVLSSNFGAKEVSGYTDVSPFISQEYSIKVRLASNDVYTAKVYVYVSDPPDDGGNDEGGDEGDTEYRTKDRVTRAL